MMRASRLPALALVAAVTLAACTSTRDALVERGFAPAYAEGYEAGCASGKAAAGGLFSEAQKDQSRYAGGGDYAKGWDEGFAKCEREMEAMVLDARTRNPSAEK